MQQLSQAYLIIQLGNRWTDVLRLLPSQPIVIGRSSECNVVINDDRVSRKHASMHPQNDGWVVADLGSRNGTQVDRETISGPHQLVSGETISVGGYTMTYTDSLTGGFRLPVAAYVSEGTADGHRTLVDRPHIVNRISNSQWSSDNIAAVPDLRETAEEPGDPHSATSPSAQHADRLAFFYQLISELVSSQSPEAAAQVALDRLLDCLNLSSGGVVTIESSGVSVKDEQVQMAVLATRQPTKGSYHRVSDFLVHAVRHDNQAVLARNIQDDSKLSVARVSGQREIISSICAPIRNATDGNDQVTGLLHVYSSGEERMLSKADLELAVGVADNLSIALASQMEKAELAKSLETSRRRVNQLEKQLDQSAEMVGDAQSLEKVRQAIQRAGPTSATVLVRGESGVGKELVARAIHLVSDRRAAPLVCLNCAALAPTLLESELFGHEKGAFTGATERKIGKFEAADGGTLLLDEIGEMPSELQAKFLRVLEGQPFERLGGNKSIQTNVRVIAATNRDLEEAVEKKEFRADLYYRLRVIEVFVPPLRDRLEDVPKLVEYFIEQLRSHAGRRLNGISPQALELLTRHDWPGNVRELRNVIERAIVLGGSSVIEPDELSISTISTRSPEQAAAVSATAFRAISLAELEQEHIYAMLRHVGGNKTKASQLLGIERSTLDRKLKRYEKK